MNTTSSLVVFIYDSDQNITWLQNANYAGSQMNWYDAAVWADQLVYGGYNDWRLPKTVDGPYLQGYDGTTTGGYNITTRELGYMYYVNLGNKALFATDGNINDDYGLSNSGPFINLDRLMVFWSGTEYSFGLSFAWAFHLNTGDQDRAWKTYDLLTAWAVRDGDVALIPNPPPCFFSARA